MISYLVFCAAGALLKLDNTYIGQFLISRPVFVGALLGMLFGDFCAGVQLGLFAEMLVLDHVPVGGHVPPAAIIWTVSALAMKIFMGVPVAWAFFGGFLLGISFPRIEEKLRHIRSGWNERAETEVLENPEGAVVKWMLLGPAMQAGAYFVFISLGAWLVGCGVLAAAKYSPVFVASGVTVAYWAVPWIGFSSLIGNLSPRRV